MKTRKSRAVKLCHAQRFREVERRLRKKYGHPRHYNPADPLDDLIFLVLSRMTQEVKYLRTYRLLRQEMPTWSVVRDAPLTALEELLHDAGLAKTKSRQIQGILKEVQRREGGLALTCLHEMSDGEVEDYLTSLPGVARKTARCVMLYALGRDTCPVDAHVWRVMKRLRLAPDRPWTEAGSRQLEESIPTSIRRSLHVTLVSHGREICRARSPRCADCTLREFCPRTVTDGSGD